MPEIVDLDVLLRPLRWLRHAPDRLLHPWRRTRARHRVRALQPRSIVVICRGNICRSPFGERYLQAALSADDRFTITSGGFLEGGKPSPQDAFTACDEMGVPLSGHESVTMTREAAAAADMVLVMEPWQGRVMRDRYGVSPDAVFVLGDFDPGEIRRRAIRDPVTRGLEAFRFCYRRMARCLDLLVHELQRERLREGLVMPRRMTAG